MSFTAQTNDKKKTFYGLKAVNFTNLWELLYCGLIVVNYYIKMPNVFLDISLNFT